MNYSNLLIILIVLIIIYLIYNHFYVRELFTLESNITSNDDSIIKGLQDLNSVFNNAPRLQKDNLLKGSYNYDSNQAKQNLPSLSNASSTLADYKSQLNVLDAQLSKISIPEPKYQSIKSLQNGMDLNVGYMNKNNYNVHFNKKCLRADSTGKYILAECDNKDPGQLFELYPIYTDIYYNAILEPGLDASVVTKSDNIKYPFVIIKSKANKNCLQNNHGSISIEPCQIKKSQRWLGLNHPINCK
jgi:hypothetical protein